MKKLVALFVLFTVPLLICAQAAPTPVVQFQAGKNRVSLRGQEQDVWFYPATGNPLHHKILFAPGDGGHQGFANTIAEKLAALGYDVYALDTRRYLVSFTGKTHLTPNEVMGDFHTLTEMIGGNATDHVILVGWSTGAGLAVLAAADANKSDYDGLVAISLGKTNILGWRAVDRLATWFGRMPHEPKFQSAEYVPQISPLPMFVIQSSRDEFIPNEDAKYVFVQAKHPKRFHLIHANNHSFVGKRDEFFATLQHGLQWITHRPQNKTVATCKNVPYE